MTVSCASAGGPSARARTFSESAWQRLGLGGSGSASTFALGGEGSSNGMQPCVLDNRPLAFCSIDKTLEIVARGRRAGAEAEPERTFARDTYEECFELQEIAQWRALSKPSVWLEPPEQFANARQRILGRVGLNTKAPHDRFERDEVLFDLQRDLAKVARGGVGAGDASRQSCPGDARGVMIP
jgi:hypothetical protein